VKTKSQKEGFERRGRNTKYFHLKPSGQKKKNHIVVLMNNGGARR
jgi:hypothetical protein